MIENVAMTAAAAVIQGDRRAVWSASPLLLRALVFGGCVATGAAVLLFVDPGTGLQAEPALAHLMRGMAAIKFLLSLVAASVLAWRFGRPIPLRLALLLMAGCWMMAAAAAMIWQYAHIGTGAVLFHAGELGLLAALWREHRAVARGVMQKPASP